MVWGVSPIAVPSTLWASFKVLRSIRWVENLLLPLLQEL